MSYRAVVEAVRLADRQLQTLKKLLEQKAREQKETNHE